MVVRSFDGTGPEIHGSAYADETAVVIGDVTVEADASVWPNAILRGDREAIRLREGANVQDGPVCHEGVDLWPGATVGHNAIVHAATVRERALVGMGATVLDDSVVGETATAAANTLVAGVPAEAKRTFEESPSASAGEEYVRPSGLHEATGGRLDG